MSQYINKVTLGLAFILVAVIFFKCRGCGCPNVVKDDTVKVKTVTVYVHDHDSTDNYVPGIDFIEGGHIPDSPIMNQGDAKNDRSCFWMQGGAGSTRIAYVDSSGKLFFQSTVDTAAIIAQYLQKVGYKDTVHTKYGFVRIYDTVTQNRIVARRVFTDFDIPLTTNTITLREKPRVKGYLGVNGFGNMGELAVGPSFALKLKNDEIFEVGPMINTRSQISYLFSIKFPITLRRK